MKKRDSQIGERISELITDLDMNNVQFADRIGVTRMAVSHWWRGYQTPSESTIREICRQFNVDYNWLTRGKYEMFLSVPRTKVEALRQDYDLSNEEVAFIMAYLEADKLTKQAIIDFNKLFITNLKKLDRN